MTIYLMENSKPTQEVADVNLPELEKLIQTQIRKLKELKNIKTWASSTASKHSMYYDKNHLLKLGIPFKPLKLVRKVGFETSKK